MKIALITTDGLRQSYLINNLSKKHEVSIIDLEFMAKPVSNIKNEYFLEVNKAEKKVFKDYINYSSVITNYVNLPSKEIMDIFRFQFVSKADLIIIYGAPYIKRPLVDYLIEKNTINLHSGLLPYYRGSGSNFWAQYDKKYCYIGGSIHFIDYGLDTGNLIKASSLKEGRYDKFEAGMYAIKNMFEDLSEIINNSNHLSGLEQIHSKNIRNTKNSDFTDQLAREFLDDYQKNKIIEVF